MPTPTISAAEFIRYLEWRISREILPPLVPWPEAIGRFGSEPVQITVDEATGDAVLSTPKAGAAPRAAGAPDSGETSPGRQDPGSAGS
jgi:hypothetical protein